MLRIFIKAKHWQLFIVLMGLMMLPMFFPKLALNVKFFFATSTLWAMLLFGWVISVGVYANSKLPDNLKKTPYIALGGLLYAVLYMAVFASLLSSKPDAMNAILPFHLIAMAFIFYSLGYSAARLASLEKGEKPAFGDYLGYIFMFWFFPIGVWGIQPKVNQLLNEHQ